MWRAAVAACRISPTSVIRRMTTSRCAPRTCIASSRAYSNFMRRGIRSIVVASLLAVILTTTPEPSRGSEPTGLPSYLYDRGDGIPTSILGTYVREKELLVYTFYEYTREKNFEYQPSALGYTGD